MITRDGIEDHDVVAIYIDTACVYHIKACSIRADRHVTGTAQDFLGADGAQVFAFEVIDHDPLGADIGYIDLTAYRDIDAERFDKLTGFFGADFDKAFTRYVIEQNGALHCVGDIDTPLINGDVEGLDQSLEFA